MRKPFAPAAIFAGTLLGAVASAQAVPSAPDAIVSVKRDRVGSDVVRVGMRSAGYPPDLLRHQLEDLGKRLNGQASRGIMITAESFREGDPSTTLVKGSCGVDGLIDRSNGRLLIAPIAQAFAGAPAPFTIHRLLISFDGEVPGAKTLQRASNRNLAFVARLVGSSIEYDVELLSQDPTKLIVDEGNGAPATPTKPPKAGVEPLTIALLAIAVAAAGALVYCLLLMLGRRPSARS